MPRSSENQRISELEELAQYYAEIRRIESAWVDEEIKHMKLGECARISGSSPWYACQTLLSDTGRRHGVAPDDIRVFSIAAYKREIAQIEANWRIEFEQNRWADAATSKDCFWARHRSDCHRADLQARHFGRLALEHGHESRSPRHLWAHIIHYAIPLADIWQRSSEQRSRNEILEKVISVLHELQIPWSVEPAYQPPYPALSDGEVVDKLRSIANRLEADDARKMAFPCSVPNQLSINKDSSAEIDDKNETHRGQQPPAPPPQHTVSVPFSSGRMVFFSDRVELCGEVICRDGRPKRLREVLDLLSQKGIDGNLVSYSGPALAQKVGIPEQSLARVIRDIREHICKALRRGDIECGSLDVILSRGPGYRLSQKLSVREYGDGSELPVSTGSGQERGRVSGTVTGRVTGTVTERRTRILQILTDGHELRLPAIASQIGRPIRTVRRDLDALRAAEKVEFVGATRTGYYAVRQFLPTMLSQADSIMSRDAATVSEPGDKAAST